MESLRTGDNRTTNTNSYLPSGRISVTSAALTSGAAQPQTQVYTEAFTYNGIGNLATVATTRNTGVAGRAAVNRSETYTPMPSTQAGPIIDQVKSVADTGTARQKSKVDLRYGFDVANRLISVTRLPGDSEVLDYGPDGELLRRRITSGGTTKDVFYFGEYGTVTATGCATSCTAVANTVAVDAHLIYAGTRIASARAASGNGATANRTLYYYRTRLGSVIGTSLRGGTAGAYYRYTPYGEVDVTNETDATRSELGYTNALRLTGSLIHLVNRAYDAEAKVFVQSDVVDRLRYTYTGGDPINRSDPTGLLQIENTNDMELAHRNPGEGSTGQKPQPKGARRDAKVDREPEGEPTQNPTARTEPARTDQGSGLAETSHQVDAKSDAAPGTDQPRKADTGPDQDHPEQDPHYKGMANAVCADRPSFDQSMVDDRERGADVVLNTQTGEYSKQNKQVGDPNTGRLTQRFYRYGAPYKRVGSVHNHGKLELGRGGRDFSDDPDVRTQKHLQLELRLEGPMMLDLGDKVLFLEFDSKGNQKKWEIKCQ